MFDLLSETQSLGICQDVAVLQHFQNDYEEGSSNHPKRKQAATSKALVTAWKETKQQH